jgi:hypothetical protein
MLDLQLYTGPLLTCKVVLLIVSRCTEPHSPQLCVAVVWVVDFLN